MMGSPRTRISPCCTGSRRFTQRISVLLPEPDGPQTTMTSPASTLRSTSSRTWCWPNHLLTLLNSMAAAMTLLDDQEDVAGVHRLAGRHPDLLHRARHGRLELVLHLHRLQHDEAVARRDGLAHRDLDESHPARHRRLEHLAALGAPGPARADDVARLL